MATENFFEIEGKILEMFPLQDGFKNNFRKREFVLEIVKKVGDKTYTETVPFTTMNDRADRLETFSIGDEVKVGFALSGRKWSPPDKPDEIKYFGSNTAITMQLLSKREATASEVAPQEVKEAKGDLFEDDTLPF
jgi:hypothetical protein